MPLEVPPGGESAREVDHDRLTLTGCPVDVRAAGEGQADHPSHLVERLPGRVVDGRPKAGDLLGDVLDEEQRVASETSRAIVGSGRGPCLSRRRHATRGGSRHTGAHRGEREPLG